MGIGIIENLAMHIPSKPTAANSNLELLLFLNRIQKNRFTKQQAACLLDEVMEVAPCEKAWTRVVSPVPHQDEPFGFHRGDPHGGDPTSVLHVTMFRV